MNNDIIIIPDVHGRTFWREAVEKYPDNDTIFLGDYLDPYPAEGITSEEAIANLEEIIAYTKTKPNVTLLMGNHDLHYLCNFGEACRLDYANSAKIHFMLMDNLWLFRIAAIREVNGKNVVFTHAPILTDWIDDVGETSDLQTLVNNLNSTLRKIMKQPCEAEDYFGHISEYRGGYLSYGSPVWADVREIDGNIIPSADLSIFAHTQLKSAPIITDKWACLDCRCAFRLTPSLEILPI